MRINSLKIEKFSGGGVKQVEKIENPAILIKIYTFAKTHYEMLREKEQED